MPAIRASNPVMVAGHSWDYTTVNRGIISWPNRTGADITKIGKKYPLIDPATHYIQHTAAYAIDDVGGALVSVDSGQLIGIYFYQQLIDSINTYFAVPASVLTIFMNSAPKTKNLGKQFVYDEHEVDDDLESRGAVGGAAGGAVGGAPAPRSPPTRPPTTGKGKGDVKDKPKPVEKTTPKLPRKGTPTDQNNDPNKSPPTKPRPVNPHSPGRGKNRASRVSDNPEDDDPNDPDDPIIDPDEFPWGDITVEPVPMPGDWPKPPNDLPPMFPDYPSQPPPPSGGGKGKPDRQKPRKPKPVPMPGKRSPRPDPSQRRDKRPMAPMPGPVDE